MVTETLNPELIQLTDKDLKNGIEVGLTPIHSNASAICFLDCYFDGCTKDDYINDLNRIVTLAKQHPDWDEKLSSKVIVLGDIITCASLMDTSNWYEMSKVQDYEMSKMQE
jgi:hypothetical protein